MQAMKDFCMWFLSELPDFFMAEPFCYLIGFAFLLVVVDLFRKIINL